MKTLSAKGQKLLKVFHLLFNFMWIGGAFSMMLLLLGTNHQESHELYMKSVTLKMIDDWLIIVGASGCVITGVIYGIWTKWGFFKQRWIIVKWILTIFMVISGTYLMGPCVNGNVYPVTEISNYTIENKSFNDNLSQITFWGIIQTILLIITVLISVYKPWKCKGK